MNFSNGFPEVVTRIAALLAGASRVFKRVHALACAPAYAGVSAPMISKSDQDEERLDRIEQQLKGLRKETNAMRSQAATAVASQRLPTIPSLRHTDKTDTQRTLTDSQATADPSAPNRPQISY